MLRRLNRLANRQKLLDMRRKLKEGAQIVQTRAQNSRWKSFLRWQYLAILIPSYILYKYVQKHYSQPKKCVRKILIIYSQNNVRINQKSGFFDYFFPVEPLALFYPQFQQQVQKVVQLCGKYGIGIHLANTDTLQTPDNLQPHENYILLNPAKINQIQIDKFRSFIKIGCGVTGKQLNETLESEGFQPMVQPALEHKQLFEIINLNLPLRQQSLKDKLINLELVSSQGRLFQSGPEIKHIGINPCFNDIFLGSKGMFGIPLSALLKIDKNKNITEKKTIKLVYQDPNFAIQTMKKILDSLQNLFSFRYIIESNESNIVINIQNYGKECLDEILRSQILSRTIETVEHSKQPFAPSAIFVVHHNDIYKMLLLNDPSVSWTYTKGLLRVNAKQQLLHKLNNKVTMYGGLLVWVRDPIMFERLKKENAIVELGEGLILQSINIREFLDPKHIFIVKKTYHNFIKKPKRWTFRKIISGFW